MATTGPTPRSSTASTTATGGNARPSDPNIKVLSVGEAAEKQLESTRRSAARLQAELNKVQGVLSDVAALAADPVGAATAAVKGALGDALKNSPLYNELKNVFNQMDIGNLKNLINIGSLNDVVKSLNVVMPTIRFPVTNADLQKVIGIAKQLKEIEAQLRALAVQGGTGLPGELTSAAFTAMRDDINRIMSTAATRDEAVRRLAEAGYTLTEDGPSLIFEDAQGNKIIDFSNGMGPIGSNMALISDLLKAFEDVKGAILVPLSNNQTLAMASFSSHIGPERFLNSSVLSALNEQKYFDVPRLLMGWVMGAPPGGIGEPVVRQDYIDRRRWEGELFQTPDEVDISPPGTAAPGELTFDQLATIIELRRTSYLEQKMREFGIR